jgi:lipopolysaccharide transport system permease protein
MVAESAAAPPVTRIEPKHGMQLPDFTELSDSRELLYLLAWRDVKVRYKQTALGALWAVIQPVLTMVVFSLIFGRVGDVPSDGVTYPVFSLAGLVVWTYFSNGLIQSSSSLVNNVPLVTKVYFPRILLPAAALLAGLVDFAISLGVLAVVMISYGVAPPARIVLAPAMVLIAIAATLGVSAGLGALNVRYRDVRYVLPFLSQLWLFLTPVAYPASLVSEPWHTLMGLNPLAGAVEGFRWCVIGTDSNPAGLVVVSAVSSIVLLFAGLLYFVRAERSFADVA